MAQLGAQLAALHALVPANVRPLLPVAAAAALGVLLLLPSSVLGAFLLGLLLGPALLAGVAVRMLLSHCTPQQFSAAMCYSRCYSRSALTYGE